MRRREFIALLGGAAAWPLGALAQQSNRVRRIGVFIGATKENDPEAVGRITALRQGLEALGWKEGHNLQIDFLFGGGDQARIQALAAEIVNSAPDVIVANSSPVVAALKQTTRTLPYRIRCDQRSGSSGLHCKLGATGCQHHWLHSQFHLMPLQGLLALCPPTSEVGNESACGPAQFDRALD